MREQVHAVFSKWLHVEDPMVLDIILAAAIAAIFPGDPVWLLIISPSGGGKTELVRALSGKYIYSVDKITSQTLISGLKTRDGKHQGILPELDGKLLVIKDLTVMLQSASNSPDENIFTQLRAAYDGEYAAAYGSGVKRVQIKASFGLIAAVTDVVDRYRAMNSALGERFLSVRMAQNPTAAIKRAQQNTGREKQMRAELQGVVFQALEAFKVKAEETGLEYLSSGDSEKVRALGEVTAQLRSEVSRDRFRNIISPPVPEVGTRLVKQLTRLAEMLKLIEAYHYKVLMRVAKDSLSQNRWRVLKALCVELEANISAISAKAAIPFSTCREVCEDMWLMGLLEMRGEGKNKLYRLKEHTLSLLGDSGLLELLYQEGSDM